jgi:hypothetical protein
MGLQLKPRLEIPDIIKDIDEMIFRYEHNYHPRKVKRIELDDFEFQYFLDEVARLAKEKPEDFKIFRFVNKITQYVYKGVEIVQR